jgi:hypothetical protein
VSVALTAAVAVVVVGCSGAPREPATPRAAASPTPGEGSTAVDGPPPPARAPTAPSPSEEPATPGFVMWARGGLPATIAADAEALDGVTAASIVASDTLGLTGTRRADGTTLETPPDGWRIPVEVAAVDPVDHAATLAAGTAAALAPLRPGGVLLSVSSAARRDLVVGDRLDLVGARDLEVVGIVPDGAVGRAEIVVHLADADAVGLGDRGTLFVEADLPDASARDALADGLERLVPADVTARLVDLGEVGRERRRAPLVLSLTQVKDTFGEFAYRPVPGARAVEIDPAWVAEHVVTVRVPLLGRVTCHRDVIEPLTTALGAIDAAGHGDRIDPSRYAGCFTPRRIRVDGTRLSHHAWGIAVDVNVDLSLPGGGEVPHDAVIRAFEDAGFVWGGRFLTPDNHHFEFVGDR